MHNIYIYIYIYIYILKRIYTQIVLIMKNNLQIILRHQPWRTSSKHIEVPTCGRPLGPLPLPTSSYNQFTAYQKVLIHIRIFNGKVTVGAEISKHLFTTKSKCAERKKLNIGRCKTGNHDKITS